MFNDDLDILLSVSMNVPEQTGSIYCEKVQKLAKNLLENADGQKVTVTIFVADFLQRYNFSSQYESDASIQPMYSDEQAAALALSLGENWISTTGQEVKQILEEKAIKVHFLRWSSIVHTEEYKKTHQELTGLALTDRNFNRLIVPHNTEKTNMFFNKKLNINTRTISIEQIKNINQNALNYKIEECAVRLVIVDIMSFTHEIYLGGKLNLAMLTSMEKLRPDNKLQVMYLQEDNLIIDDQLKKTNKRVNNIKDNEVKNHFKKKQSAKQEAITSVVKFINTIDPEDLPNLIKYIQLWREKNQNSSNSFKNELTDASFFASATLPTEQPLTSSFPESIIEEGHLKISN